MDDPAIEVDEHRFGFRFDDRNVGVIAGKAFDRVHRLPSGQNAELRHVAELATDQRDALKARYRVESRDDAFPQVALGDEEPAIAIVEIPASGPVEARVDARMDRMLALGGGKATSFEAAPPRLQLAVLAFAFERALASPDTPRYRLQDLFELTKQVVSRADREVRPGGERLARMIEGALRSWPRD